jgi:hypothetical protein
MRDPKLDSVTCSGCGRDLLPGSSAWAADWTVIAAEGTRTEVRYTCDACHEWDERTAMPATFTCLGCGRVTPDDDNGCLACDLCEGCTPTAGNCLDCLDMRRENAADKARRAELEVR